MVATLNNKQEQRKILSKIREKCEISNTELALLCDVSPTLVSYVWSGVNANKKVLGMILDNLTDGWQELLTPAELAQLEEICRN